MKILIVGVMYEPDLGPGAPLFTLLSKCLVQRGHQVTVITLVPHYPSGRVASTFRGRWLWRSVENGVKVIRIGLPSVDRSRLPQRLLQYVCYQLGAAIAGIGEQYDAVLAGNPCLSVWLPFAFLGVMRGKPIIYSVHDVYPDVGVKLGVFRSRIVIRLVAALEGYCLERAVKVRILSESFRPALHALGVPDEKLMLMYDWVDTSLIRPGPQANAFSRQYGLAGKFVVLYAGNIGFSQGLEAILSAAALLSGQEDVRFVFVGSGAGRQMLESQAADRGLANVQFLDFQPRERLPEVLASASVSLVVLRRGIGTHSLPSKTYSIMASGRPVLISIDEESEARELVLRADAGLWVPPEDASRLVAAILAMREDPALCKRLGNNGRAWAEQHHSPQQAAAVLERLMRDAISQHMRTSGTARPSDPAFRV